MKLPSLPTSPRVRRRLGLGVLLVVLGWLTFFDSHSLLRRARYAYELGQLQDENAALAESNQALAQQVRAGLSDATVERVAREQYGMRRPGETVYRTESEDE